MTPDYALRGTVGTNYLLSDVTTVGAYYQTEQSYTFDNAFLLLSACAAAGQWSIADGDRWWGRHERGLTPGDADQPPQNSSPSFEPTIDQPMEVTARKDLGQA